MPEGITSENLLNNILDSLSDSVPKHKSASFFQEESESCVRAQFNRLFGCQKPIHHCLGGGKSADSMLWRNKKISAGVLVRATAIWVLFEWLNYNFLSLLSPSSVPRLVLPDDHFIGFVAAHTLPVLYEKYEDEVNGFVYNDLERLQGHYAKLDSGVRSRIPQGSFRGKKHE
ncbi:unnamed protein product [Withania somnifera]